MFAFPNYFETSFPQCLDCKLVGNSRDFWHLETLQGNLDFTEFLFRKTFPYHLQVFIDRNLYIVNCLFFGLSLRPASWQRRTTHSVSFF
jgi:hypothetical protein